MLNFDILNGFLIYMLVSGIIMYLIVTSVKVLLNSRDKASDETQEDIDDLEDFIYTHFGNSFWHVFPQIQLLALLLGWFLLPALIYLTLTGKEEK